MSLYISVPAALNSGLVHTINSSSQEVDACTQALPTSGLAYGGEGLEIWPRAVTSGRQRVDTQGAGSDHNSSCQPVAK